MTRRRNRAALVLAYECVRRPLVGRSRRAQSAALNEFALAVLWHGPRELMRMLEQATHVVEARLLRARLALLLRVMIRADAGDYGRCPCSVCNDGVRRRGWRPLWQHAPAYDARQP